MIPSTVTAIVKISVVITIGFACTSGSSSAIRDMHTNTKTTDANTRKKFCL